MLLTLILGALVGLLVARNAWVCFGQDQWTAVCLMYVAMNEDAIVAAGGDGAEELARFTEVWPRWVMLGEVWHWDFRRYVVDQEGLAAIIAFYQAYDAAIAGVGASEGDESPGS